MNDDSVLEPLDLYNRELKEKHNQNTENYFDELVKKSGIKIEENRSTVKKYNDLNAKASIEKNKEAKARGIKTFLIILIIASLIGGAFLIYSGVTETISLAPIACYLIGAGLVLIGVLFIILISKKINKMIKESKNAKEKYMSQANEQQRIAWTQMSSLNRLYDWNIASELVEKTVPLIQMDQFFDTKKFEYLHYKYGFQDNNDPTQSTNFIQSGSILGNPFLILNTLNQRMISETYTGSLVIHWTTTSTDSKGNTRTVSHTQTLVATVKKPKPDYYYDTRLIYGNDAAPNLTFSRNPSGTIGKDEKDIDKMVKRGQKELEKMAEKSVSSGGGFTKLGNDEFDVLFGATNRDNEVQFRLLFTPLAQKNMVKLITSQQPYGDDFYFFKNKNINTILSAHSQNTDYYCRPEIFANYSYDSARKFFIDYNNNYFKSLFFDFAPLLSIPVYQQIKPKEYIYKNDIPSNIPSYEHESLANSFNKEILKPQGAATNQILKTSFVARNGNADFVNIRSNSFKATPQVDFIPKMGGDGRMHTIPVHWILYEPIYKDTSMEIENVQVDRNDFTDACQNPELKKYLNQFNQNGGIIYERGLMSMLVDKKINTNDVEQIKSFIKKEGE